MYDGGVKEGTDFLLHHELNVARTSRPRRTILALNAGIRHALTLGRHPLWSVGALWRVFGNRGSIGGFRTAWHRLRWNVLVMRLHSPASQDTDRPNPSEAIRWIPPLCISGETYDALFSHPNSTVTYTIPGQRRARIVAGCAVHPQVWLDNRGGVEFELEVDVPERSWKKRRRRRMNPAERWVDRRWRRLAIALPSDNRSDVTVRLTTRLSSDAGGSHAWSVWGEPRLEWRTTRREISQSLSRLGARIRQGGLLGTLRVIRNLQASDHHAALYGRWIELNTPAAEALDRMRTDVETLACRPRISIVTPVYNTDPRWLRACIESVRRQVYPNWELCLADDGSTSEETLRVLQQCEGDPRIHVVRSPVNRGISMASQAALEQATGEFIAVLDHDDELAPEALFEMARLLDRHPDLDFIYSDEDKLDEAGQRCDAYFKPDWSPEHFLSCMYTCHLMVLRASLVRELGGFRRGFEGAQDYDLVLRVVERTSRIHHLPLILYHWRKLPTSLASSGLAKTWAMDAGERALADHVTRSGIDAVVVPGPRPGLYRIRHRIAGRPLVSIIIPTNGRPRKVGGRTVDLLTNCVKSVVQKTTYQNYELVVADDGHLGAAAEALLESVPHRRVRFEWTGQFNYARKLNAAVRHARGDHLLLFNDDIEIITPDWIEAMLEYSQQPAIGAVGAKLLYPDGRLQHIGVVMGVCGMMAHAFYRHPGSSAGYGGSALIVRNYSAVTAACMMTRRAVYERLNGFDERFTCDFNDTDYCLRLRQEGYRIVYTPHAELCHLEAASFGARTWNAHDLEAMRRAWGDVCERDPYYNPHLTRDFPDYRVRV